MRLLLDEHCAHAIADRLRAAGADVQTVAQRGLAGAADGALLTLCAQEGRALLTNNARDFVALAREWAAGGRHHAGILLTSDASLPRHKQAIGRHVTLLTALMEAHPGDTPLTDQVLWLP